MELFNNKYFKIFRVLRTIFYICFFLAFMIIPTSFFIENNQICFYVRNYNLLCPTCGVTRAFSSIMHFNYVDAFNFNPIFTTSFGPIFIFLFTEDLFNIIITLILKKERYSIMEYIVLRYI